MVNKRAFTLIETLIVISILMLLSGIAFSTHRNTARKAREATLKHNLTQMRYTLDQYNNDKGHYPESVQVLVDEGYLRQIPMDPITKSKDSWEVVMDDDLFDDPEHVPGVFDVRSGSLAPSIDGTLYNEW